MNFTDLFKDLFLDSLLFFFFAIFAGNGYIEGKELENFFQELEKARKGSGMVSPVPSPITWNFLSS